MVKTIKELHAFYASTAPNSYCDYSEYLLTSQTIKDMVQCLSLGMYIVFNFFPNENRRDMKRNVGINQYIDTLQQCIWY